MIVLLLLGCGGPEKSAGAAAPDLGPFVPTPMPVARRMLEVAGVTKDDVVYDLGCGDGRIVIEAAKAYGARGIGIEYDLHLAQEARERAEREGVAHLVEIRGEDITRSDFSDATVVMLYLLPASNEALRPRLQALKPGTRIVSHDYPIGDWKPLRTEVLNLPGGEYHHVVRLWRAGE
ncbi:MAG TPA: class I SAM-dependent methyltransferase [Planctomycetota bacterium]|nr:class I SAM-dependent methyltransferase [Planctomycetota bacterium]